MANKFPPVGKIYQAKFGELAYHLNFDADGKTMNLYQYRYGKTRCRTRGQSKLHCNRSRRHGVYGYLDRA